MSTLGGGGTGVSGGDTVGGAVGGRDFIDKDQVLSAGSATSFDLEIAQRTATSQCRLKIWRQNGTDLDFIGQSELFDVDATGVQTFTLSSPASIAVLSGDYFGVMLNEADLDIRFGESTGDQVLWLNGDLSVDTPEADFNTSIFGDNQINGTVYGTLTNPDSLIITTPDAYQTLQRDGSDQADISIEGTYAGTPTAIEASFNGGSYSTIDASPSGNVFSGTLSNQAHGQGTLTARFTNDTGITNTVLNFGIGEVFIVMGQSNAAGRLTNDQTNTSNAAMFKLAGSWAEMEDPTGDNASFGSVWPLLASLVTDNESVPAAFLTLAVGGTALVNGTWEKGEIDYENAVTRVAASNINDARCILWYQGEQDAANAATQEAYQTALSQMVDDFQTDTGLSSLQLIAVSIGPFSTDDNNTRIRKAIQNRWDNDSDILPGPVMCDFDGVDVHIATDDAGQMLAERWWWAIDFNFFSGTDGRGPRFSSAQKTDTDEITVSFTVANSPLQAIEIDGWRVDDDTGTLTVSGAAIQSSTQAVLTLNRSLDPNPVVSYGYGDDTIGVYFRDSSDVPQEISTNNGLPPEPFFSQEVVLPGEGGLGSIILGNGRGMFLKKDIYL